MATRPVYLSQKPAIAGTSPATAGTGVRLEAGDYLLRSMTADDASLEVLDWFNDSVMLRGLNVDGLAFTIESFRAFIARFDNDKNYIIGIFLNNTDCMVGFYTVEVNKKHRSGTLTSGIGDHALHGRGVLRQTIEVLLDEFFENRGIQKLSARVLARNLRMIFNFKSSTRFIREAILRKELCTPQGERVDVIVFSAFAPGIMAREGQPTRR